MRGDETARELGGEGGEDKVVCLACQLSDAIYMIVGTQAASQMTCHPHRGARDAAALIMPHVSE